MVCLGSEKKAATATFLASAIFLLLLAPPALSCPGDSCSSADVQPVEEGPVVGVGGLAPPVADPSEEGMNPPPPSPLPVEQPPPASLADPEVGSGSPPPMGSLSFGKPIANPMQTPIEGVVSPPPLLFGMPFGSAAQQGPFEQDNGQPKAFDGAYQQQQPGDGASGFGQQPLGNQLSISGVSKAGGWVPLGLAALLSLGASGSLITNVFMSVAFSFSSFFVSGDGQGSKAAIPT